MRLTAAIPERAAAPGMRLLGYAVEYVFSVILWLIGASSTNDGSVSSFGVTISAGVLVVGAVVVLAIWIGYVVWWVMLARSGYTPIKRLLGMRVVKVDGTPATLGTMLVRTVVGKWLLAWFTFSIYPVVDGLWLLWDKDQQCLHDKMAKTVVVRVSEAETIHAVPNNQPARMYGRQLVPPEQVIGFSAQSTAQMQERWPQAAPVAGDGWADIASAARPSSNQPRDWPHSPTPVAPQPRPARPPMQAYGSPTELLRKLEADRRAGRVAPDVYRQWRRKLEQQQAAERSGYPPVR